jgi:hypothetical protein
MASYATTDLRAEINRCRGGKDGRVTIEHRHERHRDIEGRNLEKDFDSHAPSRRSPSAREAYPPSSLFLQIYSTSILATGGDEVIMANYFPIALTGTTRSWLMNLPKGTLDSWPELCR